MTATEKAEKKINDTLKKTRQEHSQIEDEIKGFEIKKANASGEMDRAEAACNLKDYTKARTTKDETEAALEMYRKRKNRLESEALISEAEYNSLCAGIVSEVDNYISSLKEEVYQATAALEEKSEEATELINNANKTLHSLQYDLYRGHDLEYNSGMKNPKESSIRKAGNREQWEIIAWAGEMKERAIYKDMKKERSANE